MQGRELRRRRQPLPVRGHGCVGVAARVQRKAEVVPRRGVIGLQRKRTVEGGDRLRKAFVGGEHDAAVVVELGLPGHQGCRAVQQLQRLRQPVALVVHHAEVMERRDEVGRSRERLAVQRFRGVDVAFLMGGYPCSVSVAGSAADGGEASTAPWHCL